MELEVSLDDTWNQIRELANDALEEETQFVNNAVWQLQQSTKLDLNKASRTLDNLGFSFRHLWQGLLIQEQNFLENYFILYKKELRQYFNIEKEYGVEMLEQLHQQLKNISKTEDQWLENSESKLRLLDPNEILKRGYSYTLHKGKIITSTNEIDVGDEITTQLYQGEITSILKDKKENG